MGHKHITEELDMQNCFTELCFQSHSSTKVQETSREEWASCDSRASASCSLESVCFGSQSLCIPSKYSFMSSLTDEVLRHGPWRTHLLLRE